MGHEGAIHPALFAPHAHCGTADVSEWLETIYDQDEQSQQLTHESLRLEAEEEVDRLLESS